ncbi:MAG: PAS domain S-box protein, partial [Prolixibacteraceae bacterium]
MEVSFGLISIQPIHRGNLGKPLYFITSIVDITKQKMAEEAMKISENKFRSIFNNLQDAFFQADLSGRFTLVSPSAVRMYGYDSESEMKGMPASKLYADETMRDKLLRKLLTDDSVIDYVGLGKRKDDSVFWVSMNIQYRYENGNIAGTEGVVRDISERIQTELELRNKNEFIQTVLDNLPMGVALNTIDDGAVTYMNKKFEEIYGWPKEDILDQSTFFQKVYPDEEYRMELMTGIIQDIQSGDPARMHWENCLVTHQDGTRHVVKAVNIPLFDQNTMVSTVFDITDIKNAEASLRESIELNESLIRTIPFGINIVDEE